MKSYNWGIIGPGNIAHDFAKDMQLIPVKQQITAVLSHHEDSANEFANEFDVKRKFTNIDDFIKNGKADIAYIATPHPFHYEAIKACLTNHVAVLCEKPIVINHEQYEELSALSKKNKTFLMEGMWIRFLPSFRKLMELIDKKTIGEIISIKAAMNYKAPRDENSRYYDPSKGGGSLLDLGVYCVFLSTLLLGKPKEIKSVGRLSDKNIDEACAIILSYSHGRYAVLESSLLKRRNTAAEIFGTKGTIRIMNPWFEKSPGIEIEKGNGDLEKIKLSWEGHGLQFEMEEAINCLSKHKIKSALMPERLTGNVLKIMDEIRNQIHVTYDKYE